MDTQSIVFTAPGRAELIEEPLRIPKANEVVVETWFSTISGGTERANLVGDPNISISTIDQAVHFPRRCGYSSSGVVVQVGEAVHSLRPGDRVAVSWGTHSRYQVVSEGNVHRIESDKVSMPSAAMGLIASFPLAAIRKCRLEIGESALVMGQGILGLIAVSLLHAAGAAPVIAVDPVAKKREDALKAGADAALDPYAPDFTERARQLTGRGVNVAIEVTGVGKALDQALDCMAPMGRVALLGCTRHADFTIDYYRKVHGPGISLIGAHTQARPQQESSAGLWTHHDDIMALMRLMALGRLNLENLIERTCPVSDAPQVFKSLAEEASFPVTQFDWRTRR